ncbi:MAG: DNA/RNA non-specific endonuclease [Kiritimatiellae bacterium]|nr:DNA/RNA non-specific endonuclease [Kiritimatiellia bacterium]
MFRILRGFRIFRRGGRWFLRRALRRYGWFALGIAVATNAYVHFPASRHEGGLAHRAVCAVGNATADITDSLGWTGRDVAAPAGGCADPGFPRRLPGGRAPGDITLLARTGYTAGYSPSLRHPVWVTYKTFPYDAPLTPPEIRPKGFAQDKEAPRSPKTSDYARSGYDRGHMAPNLAIAERYGKTAQEETFLLSNICPQRPGLNQGPWYEMEYRLSEVWPFRYGEVWVIVGAVQGEAKRTLKGGIDVPEAFYQIALTKGRDGRLRAQAVLMPQTVSRHAYARSRLISVRELEALTGLDFFPALPPETQEALETETPSRLWPTGLRGLFKVLVNRYRRY